MNEDRRRKSQIEMPSDDKSFTYLAEHERLGFSEGSLGKNSHSESFSIPVRFTRSGRKRSTPFPFKLMKVLSEPNNKEIISWTPSGKAFIILNPKSFCEEILLIEFKSAKFSSFTRKLHRWGFTRLYKGCDAGAFYNENFQKDRPDLVEKMLSSAKSKKSPPTESAGTKKRCESTKIGKTSGPFQSSSCGNSASEHHVHPPGAESDDESLASIPRYVARCLRRNPLLRQNSIDKNDPSSQQNYSANLSREEARDHSQINQPGRSSENITTAKKKSTDTNDPIVRVDQSEGKSHHVVTNINHSDLQNDGIKGRWKQNAASKKKNEAQYCPSSINHFLALQHQVQSHNSIITPRLSQPVNGSGPLATGEATGKNKPQIYQLDSVFSNSSVMQNQALINHQRARSQRHDINMALRDDLDAAIEREVMRRLNERIQGTASLQPASRPTFVVLPHDQFLPRTFVGGGGSGAVHIPPAFPSQSRILQSTAPVQVAWPGLNSATSIFRGNSTLEAAVDQVRVMLHRPHW